VNDVLFRNVTKKEWLLEIPFVDVLSGPFKGEKWSMLGVNIIGWWCISIQCNMSY
jgi:hypothetical protein